MRSMLLLLRLDRIFDRNILKGISQYIVEQSGWYIDIGSAQIWRNLGHAMPQADGIIAEINSQGIRDFIATKPQIPIVGIGNAGFTAGNVPIKPYVAVDSGEAIRMAMQHLTDIGHIHVALCSYQAGQGSDIWVDAREQAFVNAGGDEALIFRGKKSNGLNQESETIPEWLQQLPKPIGIIGIREMRAYDVYTACQILGLKIPQEVSIIGVDNDDTVNCLTGNFISSIDLRTEWGGYKAAECLDKIVSGKALPDIITVPSGNLIQRQSTAFINSQDLRVIRAVELINSEFHKASPESIAHQTGLSRSHLERLFIQELNKSMHQFLIERKLNYAVHLASTSSMTAGQVAEACGFSTASYLISAMKKHLGQTFSQIKRSESI